MSLVFTSTSLRMRESRSRSSSRSSSSISRASISSLSLSRSSFLSWSMDWMTRRERPAFRFREIGAGDGSSVSNL